MNKLIGALLIMHYAMMVAVILSIILVFEYSGYILTIVYAIAAVIVVKNTVIETLPLAKALANKKYK